MTKRLLAIYLVLVVLVAGLIPGCTGAGPQTYDLTMAENPAAGGTATDVTGGSPYEEGTQVSIQAVAASCYRFTGWSAPAGTFDDAGAATTNFTMPAQDVIVTANFEAITLGHFKFYDLDDQVTWPPIEKEVQLEDQFGTFTAMVKEPIVFGNAADKVHNDVLTPMGDPDHHLTLYRLELQDLPGTWYVEVKNQFGESQSLTVTGPVWLAVPTQKEGHEEPECLDHFLVYEVAYQPFESVPVELNDQFTQETVTVYEPAMFANPVKKTLGTEVTDIQNPDDHLVFYWIEGAPFERTVNVNNQLSQEVQAFDLTDPALMAVPSEKLDWGEQIDHFKCYALGPNPPVGEVVDLSDQFVDITANVSSAGWFCNPAQKWEEPILNEDHHLTIYFLDDVDTDYWGVTVSNQFDPIFEGPQELIVSGPVALAVPTQKLSPYSHEPPVGLDHYLLYFVESGASVQIPVSLTDEFGVDSEVLVVEPAFFAIPVQKTHQGTVTPIENSLAHLVFYKIAGSVFEPFVVVNNQFGFEQGYDVLGPDMLAVPSLKLDVWEPL